MFMKFTSQLGRRYLNVAIIQTVQSNQSVLSDAAISSDLRDVVPTLSTQGQQKNRCEITHSGLFNDGSRFGINPSPAFRRFGIR